MKDFVRDATSEAVIIGHAIDGKDEKDYNSKLGSGITAIPADENDGNDYITTIIIDIRNPQGYKLDLELKGTGADSGKVSIKPSSNGQYATLTIGK